MRLLLDTQAFLWMQTTPERLHRRALALIEDPDTELFLSAASSWEIAIKYGLKKLDLPESPEEYVPSRMERSRTLALGVQHIHALRTAMLPPHHRDPFDRLLIAQSQIESMPLLTSDQQLAKYDIEIIRA